MLLGVNNAGDAAIDPTHPAEYNQVCCTHSLTTEHFWIGREERLVHRESSKSSAVAHAYVGVYVR